jgi:RNA polymerase sigma-70 factor (ECF subfamily)
LSTWLTTIAINVCRSHYRTRMFRATFWKNWMSGQIDEPAQADASENVEQKERIEQVTRAVRRLKTDYREVVVMHYLEAMTVDEIQQVLGISRNMVEVRLHRARKMLHEMLEPMIGS